MAQSLTQKEMLFCFYYHALRNCKDAAIKAGYPSISAEKQGVKLLNQKKVASLIKKLSDESKKEELLDLVISGLKRLAFSSSSDSLKLFLTDRDKLLKEIDSLDLFHISEIKIPKDNSIEIKFFDRYKAFDKLIEIASLKSNNGEINEFYNALEKSASSLNKESDTYDV